MVLLMTATGGGCLLRVSCGRSFLRSKLFGKISSVCYCKDGRVLSYLTFITSRRFRWCFIRFRNSSKLLLFGGDQLNSMVASRRGKVFSSVLFWGTCSVQRGASVPRMSFDWATVKSAGMTSNEYICSIVRVGIQSACEDFCPSWAG